MSEHRVPPVLRSIAVNHLITCGDCLTLKPKIMADSTTQLTYLYTPITIITWLAAKRYNDFYGVAARPISLMTRENTAHDHGQCSNTIA